MPTAEAVVEAVQTAEVVGVAEAAESTGIAAQLFAEELVPIVAEEEQIAEVAGVAGVVAAVVARLSVEE